MENNAPSFFDKLNQWMRNSLTFKLFTIGFLILILLIPIAMIQSIINERKNLRDNATQEISSKWGDDQVIGGPIISIPYRETVKNNDDKTEKTEVRYAHFLPEKLGIVGDIKTEQRQRGIYTVVLYNSRLTIEGRYNALDFDKLGVEASRLELNNAFISIGISDLKGVREKIMLTLNSTEYALDPGMISNDIFSSGVSIPVKINATGGMDFKLALDLNGSSSIYFLPFGKETNVNLTSQWGSPSFEGSFLPDTRTVEASGFKANWKVLHLNRNYPQQGTGSFISTNDIDNNIDNTHRNNNYDYPAAASNSGSHAAEFGVRLMLPVDEYLKTMRSAKYSVMFVILTFLVVFFSEILRGVRVHAIQYLLVGFAISLFYLLLLSFSEHSSFNKAYLVASAAILGLIGFYVQAIFKNMSATVVICATLAILYGFFYTLLQLEDYALLLGSLGLLLILAGVMYLTRNIDWYNIRKA
jgi:inner membrane protein